jgi:hypothetical protein
VATRLSSVKALLLTLAALACSAGTHRRGARAPLTPAPALVTNVSYFGQSGIGLGCLPRAGNSTLFEVDIIVDSLRDKNGAALSLIRRARSAPPPGYIHQTVTVEVQRANQTRFFGTVCWHDAGIVVRAPATALADAKVFLDASGTILVRVFDGRGRVVGDSTRILKESSGDRISWLLPPPDTR